MKEIHNEKSRSEYFTFTPLSDTRDEGCTHASSPTQSWTKSVFNSYEEAFVDFRDFLTELWYYKMWWHKLTSGMFQF